jgi:hypothetical protein
MFAMATTRLDTLHGGYTWAKAMFGGVHKLTFSLKNYGTVPAVFNRIRCTRQGPNPIVNNGLYDNTNRILPIHFSNNYFSLAPGDSESITITFDDADLGAGNTPLVTVEGVNMPLDTITQGSVHITSVQNNAAKTGISAVYGNKCLKLCNIPLGNQWQVSMYTMQGKTALNTKGMANSSTVMVSTAHMLPGVYAAVLKSAGETFRSVVTIKQ